MHRPISMQSVETKASWTIATVVLVILTLSFGAPWITIVALKSIAAETDGLRSVPALATSLAWIGFGAGGIAMGYVASHLAEPGTALKAEQRGKLFDVRVTTMPFVPHRYHRKGANA